MNFPTTQSRKLMGNLRLRNISDPEVFKVTEQGLSLHTEQGQLLINRLGG
jgi:hypothetical protein